MEYYSKLHPCHTATYMIVTLVSALSKTDATLKPQDHHPGKLFTVTYKYEMWHCVVLIRVTTPAHSFNAVSLMSELYTS